ncbi:hypothetical protein L1049_026925 [Liquidambar formosana]|uniref:Uncharacterized protein n=1 Tax=Liquidambar formosana TaxID=63359 RepID=A0AAP0R6U1_LIQFO
MAATRLLRTSYPLHLVHPSSSSSSSSYFSNSSLLPSRTIRSCQTKTRVTGERRPCGDAERRPSVAVKASVAASESVVTSKPETSTGRVDLPSLPKKVTDAVLKFLRSAVKQRPWKLPGPDVH